MTISTSWKYIILVVVGVLCLLLAASTATATQSMCTLFTEGAAKLKKEYGETPIFRGVSQAGHLIVLFYNSETASWTVGRLVPQNPNIMCPLDAGIDGYIHSDTDDSKESMKENNNDTSKL